MRILFVVTTGRIIFRQTLDMIADNIVAHGHNGDQHVISALINYDSCYRSIPASSFRYGENAVFREVRYLGNAEMQQWRMRLLASGVPPQAADLVTTSTGYGNKKNLVLLHALENSYDIVVFWDDDEYPLACVRKGDSIEWVATDILGAHLCSDLPYVDVTSGFRTGYGAPIVPEICHKLSEETARSLGRALSLGTEFIREDILTSPESTFLVPLDIPERHEIALCSGGKWVAGGNIAVRIRSLREGLIPPYYAPRNARGEDTIFSMQLRSARVIGVPSGIFHDCFLIYPEITKGQYPRSFDRKVGQEHCVQRFASALNGWFAYSPLMLRLRDERGWRDTVRAIAELLEVVDSTLPVEVPELAEHLPTPLSSVIQHYAATVEQQVDELSLLSELWPQMCHSMVPDGAQI